MAGATRGWFAPTRTATLSGTERTVGRKTKRHTMFPSRPMGAYSWSASRLRQTCRKAKKSRAARTHGCCEPTRTATCCGTERSAAWVIRYAAQGGAPAKPAWSSRYLTPQPSNPATRTPRSESSSPTSPAVSQPPRYRASHAPTIAAHVPAVITASHQVRPNQRSAKDPTAAPAPPITNDGTQPIIIHIICAHAVPSAGL